MHSHEHVLVRLSCDRSDVLSVIEHLYVEPGIRPKIVDGRMTAGQALLELRLFGPEEQGRRTVEALRRQGVSIDLVAAAPIPPARGNP